jgi:hypothetical protein
MTTRTRKATLPGRIRILAALGVTGLALIVASPANAIYRDYEAGSEDPPVTTRTVERDNPPVDKDGNESCRYNDEYYPHGTTATITKIDKDGNAVTYNLTCIDGVWRGTYSSQLEAIDYTYSPDGGFYSPAP